MKTIRDLKRRIDVFNHSLKVSVNTIAPDKYFEKEYETWDEFKEDDSIDNLVLYERHCLDIFDYEIEIWVE